MRIPTFTHAPAHFFRFKIIKPLKSNINFPQVLGSGKAIWRIRDQSCYHKEKHQSKP
jgi:hypothetical protein